MGGVNVGKMNDIEAERAMKREQLRVLTSSPFDLTNELHTKALKKALNGFEYTVNLMYLYQAMSSGLTAYFGSWAVGAILPIPEFIKTFLSAALYIGVAGYMLGKFSMTDFYDELSEMKEIYNWSLKGGQEHYNSSIDNKTILADADIQRMIKLMAPLCNNDFLLAWPKESKSEEPKSTVSNFFSYGYSAISSTASFIYSPVSFFSPTQPTIDQNRIRELKVGVETRSFDLGVMNGLEQSMRYFATNTEFRNLLATKIKEPIETVKNMIPNVITSFTSSHSN